MLAISPRYLRHWEIHCAFDVTRGSSTPLLPSAFLFPGPNFALQDLMSSFPVPLGPHWGCPLGKREKGLSSWSPNSSNGVWSKLGDQEPFLNLGCCYMFSIHSVSLKNVL